MDIIRVTDDTRLTAIENKLQALLSYLGVESVEVPAQPAGFEIQKPKRETRIFRG